MGCLVPLVRAVCVCLQMNEIEVHSFHNYNHGISRALHCRLQQQRCVASAVVESALLLAAVDAVARVDCILVCLRKQREHGCASCSCHRLELQQRQFLLFLLLLLLVMLQCSLTSGSVASTSLPRAASGRFGSTTASGNPPEMK